MAESEVLIGYKIYQTYRVCVVIRRDSTQNQATTNVISDRYRCDSQSHHATIMPRKTSSQYADPSLSPRKNRHIDCWMNLFSQAAMATWRFIYFFICVDSISYTVCYSEGYFQLAHYSRSTATGYVLQRILHSKNNNVPLIRTHILIY